MIYADLESIIDLQKQLEALTERVEKLEKEVRESAGEKFNYTIFPNPAPAAPNGSGTINYTQCFYCKMFHPLGQYHYCPNAQVPTTTANPTGNITYTQAAQNT